MIISEIASDKHKKLIAHRSTKKVLICGDYEDKGNGIKGPTSAMVDLNKMFRGAKINSFMLNHIDTQLDHNSKEMIALENADMIVLINGRSAGTVGETAISMSGVLGMKTLFLYKDGELSRDMLMSELEYTAHFPIKYPYMNDADMINKAFNFGKQLLNCICKKEINNGGGGNEPVDSKP